MGLEEIESGSESKYIFTVMIGRLLIKLLRLPNRPISIRLKWSGEAKKIFSCFFLRNLLLYQNTKKDCDIWGSYWS
jgi:hypothetical protein